MTTTPAQRYRELAQKRRRLEEEAEESMNTLVETLGKIRDLDPEQRQAGWDAGMFDPKTLIKPLLHEVLAPWIGARLGGRGGYVKLVEYQGYQRPLAELDRLAKDPTEEEGA